MNVSTYIAVEGWLAGEPQNLPNFPAAKQNLQNWRIVELSEIFSKELKCDYLLLDKTKKELGYTKMTYIKEKCPL